MAEFKDFEIEYIWLDLGDCLLNDECLLLFSKANWPNLKILELSKQLYI